MSDVRRAATNALSLVNGCSAWQSNGLLVFLVDGPLAPFYKHTAKEFCVL